MKLILNNVLTFVRNSSPEEHALIIREIVDQSGLTIVTDKDFREDLIRSDITSDHKGVLIHATYVEGVIK